MSHVAVKKTPLAYLSSLVFAGLIAMVAVPSIPYLGWMVGWLPFNPADFGTFYGWVSLAYLCIGLNALVEREPTDAQAKSTDDRFSLVPVAVGLIVATAIGMGHWLVGWPVAFWQWNVLGFWTLTASLEWHYGNLIGGSILGANRARTGIE